MAADGFSSTDPAPPVLVMPGRRVPVGEGFAWIGEGWALFRRSMLMWLVVLVLFVIVHVTLSLLPFVGLLAGNLVGPVIMAGIVVGCRSLETGGDLELEHLLAGFRRGTRELLITGVLYTLGQVAILAVFALFVGLPFVLAIVSGDETALARAMPLEADFTGIMLTFALGTLVSLALAVPLMAAYWFAPALVVLNGVGAVEAMRESFFAAFRNFVPFLAYGVAMLALLVIAVLPLALGLAAWMPLLFASSYASYRGVFTEPDADA